MTNFLFAFHGGSMPDTPEEGAKIMAKWGAWMESLGSTLSNPGAPLGMSKTVSTSGVTDDGGANPVSGYMVVEAKNMEGAIAISKGCPILENGGSIEIAETIDM